MATRGDRSVGWPVKTTSAWDGAPIGYCYALFKRAPRNQLKSAVKTPITIIAKKQQQFQKHKQTDWPVKTTSAWDSAPTGYCYAPFKRAPRNQLKSAVKTPLTIIAEKQQRFQKHKQTDWFGCGSPRTILLWLPARVFSNPFRTPT